MKLNINNGFIIDRRTNNSHKPMAAIPPNYMGYFNEAQVNTYIKLKKIGWKLFFIRRPRLRKHTIAMINNVGTRAAVINPDGSFDFHSTTIKMRLQKKT